MGEDDEDGIGNRTRSSRLDKISSAIQTKTKGENEQERPKQSEKRVHTHTHTIYMCIERVKVTEWRKASRGSHSPSRSAAATLTDSSSR